MYRKNRRINKIISLAGLLPAGLFFIACFYEGKHSESTILESMIDAEKYWRIVGPFGLLFVFVLYISLERLIPYKRGIVRLTPDKITIERNGKQAEFDVEELKNFEFKLDIPVRSDNRPDFQKASILRFTVNNRKFDLEISIENSADLESLTPLMKSWKEVNSEFKFGYS